MKKAITLLVCLVVCIVGYARTISISTEDRLQDIAGDVNDRNINHSEDTIILTDDITLTREWEPIGKSNKPFSGVFDGQNHTISNLCIRNYNQDRVGLFGCIDGATIRNVVVYGNISTGKKKVGGICGLIQNNSKIENCHFIGQIRVNASGDAYVGGVVGEILNGGTVDKCSSTGLIYGKTNEAKCIGGVVGRCGTENNDTTNLSYPQSYITNCINLSDVYGFSSVGGIIAYASYRTTVENCLNCGNINGFTPPTANSNKYFGGIIGGYYAGMQAYNCLSAGNVNNDKPSATIGFVRETLFPDRCPKVNIYYDHQRMWKNHSGHGTAKNTDEIIEESLNDSLIGWVFDGGYPYPKDFTNESVITVAKSYALFSNSETYDDIHTNFTVSDFAGTAWGSTDRGLTEINGRNVNILADGRDTLTVRCGSYYKNVIVDVNVPTPLPITLLYFTVTETDCGNLLEWATATERHNAGFSLMRSPDATDWEAFAWKPTLCGGNSTVTTEYSYMDTDIRWDTTYYKFVQYDSVWSQSGAYYPESSEIMVAMRRGGKPELPNIMYDGRCILLVAGSATTDAYAYDTTGRLIYDTRLKPHATARLVVRGNAIVEFLWVENGELMRKSYKVGYWY